jgi:hypothetical protein
MLTDTVLLIRPSGFMYNSETAGSNSFQKKSADLSFRIIQNTALAEFDNFMDTLKQNGIEVLVFDDTPLPVKPDAVFPNNWISFHRDGRAVIYPLYAANRRTEKRMDIVDSIRNSYYNYKLVDLSYFEASNLYLEGTGSQVFDHSNKCTYASLSPRTHREPLLTVATLFGYEPIWFSAKDRFGLAIYHTNVMLCIGEAFVLICSESITDITERERVVKKLAETGRVIIDFDFDQMESFCCNAIELRNSDGQNITVLSKTAFDAFSPEQSQLLSAHTRLLPIPIPTIEKIGGGSARCMIAEVFRPAS